MKEIRWNELKNKRLKLTRGVSFEEILKAESIGIKRHPTRESQDVMLFKYRSYIWVVPYVEGNGYIFLKTLYPCRKYTKLYKKGELL
jgi:hypothetical protein